MRRPPRGRRATGLRLASFGFGLLLLLTGCSPFYVIRAGWSQAKIMRSRVPLTQVMTDPAGDPARQAKLRLAWDARAFAVEELGFENTGDSYTSYAELQSDTLAMVLSAAYPDRLAFRTWWFPIVGHVPYRAYFSLEAGEAARAELESEGFDTYLRPTGAFSTLGWFADPLYSSIVGRDEVALAETVFHELAHNHLYVPGRGRFNESFATFVGNVAAIRFFCTRGGGGTDTVKCRRARDRWQDALDISRFVDALEEEILSLYSRRREALGETENEPRPTEDFLAVRDSVYAAAQARFVDEIQPGLRASTYSYLASEPLNNATFLARSLYVHRLPDFDTFWESWDGDFPGMMGWIREAAPEADDPFAVLARTGVGAARGTSTGFLVGAPWTPPGSGL